jgi:hypothetical protein
VLIAVYANGIGHLLPTHDHKRRDSHVSEFHFNCSSRRLREVREIMMHYYIYSCSASALTLGFIHIAFHSHGRALLNNIGEQRKQPGGRLLVIQTPNFRFRKCWPDGLPPHDQVNAITLTPSLSLG